MGVVMHHSLVPSVPWSLLEMRSEHSVFWIQFLCLYFVLYRTVFVFRTQCTFQWYLSCFPMLDWFGFPVIPYLIGAPVSRGAPVSIAVCHLCLILPDLSVFFHCLSREFLAYKGHLSYLLHSYILGVSVIFDDLLLCCSVVWSLPWSAGVIFVVVYLPPFLFLFLF